MSHAVVIGAGVIGVCSAAALLRDGWTVTILDPGPAGGAQSASYGNGAWLSPSSVVPMALPGLWRRVPGYLLDRTGPLTIRPRAALVPWVAQFMLAGATVPRVERTARALRALVGDAPVRHRALADAAGVPGMVAQRGLLYAYPNRAAFVAEALAWRLRHDNGVRWQELEGAALFQAEPALGRQYTFGVLVMDGAHCTDPGGYVAALAAHAVAHGARVETGRATGFTIDAGRLSAVHTTTGTIPCTAAVVAAGAWSATLARQLGNRVPLQSERGYHVTIDPGDAPMPRLPLMPSDGKMSVTLLDGRRLRVAGQVELAGLHDAPDWRRAEILRGWAHRLFPQLAPDCPAERWMGHRPSIADGLPVIGPARHCAQVVHAFGHGHVGLASGPVTGQLVADLLAGRAPVIDPAPYRPGRFRRGVRRTI